MILWVGWLVALLILPGSIMCLYSAGGLAGLQGPRWPHSGIMSGSWCRLLARVPQSSSEDLEGSHRPDQLPYNVRPGQHSKREKAEAAKPLKA